MELGSGQVANAGFVFLDDVDDLDGQIGGEKWPIPDDIHSMPEGVAVMKDLFGLRGEIGAVSVGGKSAIEFVVGGENVLDFGTELRFLEREGVEQDVGIRNAVRSAFQFCQLSAGAGRSLLRTRAVSSSAFGGRSGSWLKGLSGLKCIRFIQ